jgi:hypothetical protein
MTKTKEEMRLYKRDWSRKKYNITKESLFNSTTYKGRRAELLALTILEGSIDMNLEVMNRPYDLKYKGLKIDVKSCELYKRKVKKGKLVKFCRGWWVFNKNKGYADKYFCLCLIKDIPIRYYLIPKKEFNKGITIGWKSKKFDKYLINKIL